MNPDLSRYVEKMTALGMTETEIVEHADTAAMLAAAGVTAEQAQVFAKVAATGRFTVDSFLMLRERGIDMPKETAEHLLYGNPPRHHPSAMETRKAAESLVVNIAKAIEAAVHPALSTPPADDVPEVHLKAGVYRNALGAELHVTGPLITPMGSRVMSIGGIYVAESRDFLFGPVTYHVTPESLRAVGYELIETSAS